MQIRRSSTQIIKRKRIRELAHEDARADCSAATRPKGECVQGTRAVTL